MINQVLNIDQMRHLKELGVDTSKASMFYVPKLQPKNEYQLMNVQPSPVIPFIPAFTLQDIIELLPKTITAKDSGGLIQTYDLYLAYSNVDVCYCVFYSYSSKFGCLELFKSESLLEAAYQMLCWCAENGYLKGGEK